MTVPRLAVLSAISIHHSSRLAATLPEDLPTYQNLGTLFVWVGVGGAGVGVGGVLCSCETHTNTHTKHISYRVTDTFMINN